MTKTLSSKLRKLPAARQKKINARAKDLIAQETTLRDLRKALELTQIDVAHKLNIKQESVSRLERRSDLLLSTLVTYIRSMGGELSLTAKFPNRPSIKLKGFEEIEPQKRILLTKSVSHGAHRQAIAGKGVLKSSFQRKKI